MEVAQSINWVNPLHQLYNQFYRVMWLWREGMGSSWMQWPQLGARQKSAFLSHHCSGHFAPGEAGAHCCGEAQSRLFNR